MELMLLTVMVVKSNMHVYAWESSGNSASIHDRLQPVTSHLSMNGVDVVDCSGCQEQHVYACFRYSGNLGDGIHE